MHDPENKNFIHQLGYIEGLPVVESPGIIAPKEFLDEDINIRFPNPYLGDTSARIDCDTSQKIGIRFEITIKSHLNNYKNTDKLVAIPLDIAG